MASIDPLPARLTRTVEYLVPDWVRVRRESFGLLFYDTRSTKLTFVRSGDSLDAAALHGPAARAGGSAAAARRAVRRSRDCSRDLVAKGLLVAADTSTE